MSKLDSPFKFLDPYEKNDGYRFFGRETEISNLKEMVTSSWMTVVFGPTGSGKSSLVKCGLANSFTDNDWMEIYVRREKNINQSLIQAIDQVALTPLDKNQDNNLYDDLKSVYLDYFRPLYLVVDQIEELFYLGTAEEQLKFFEQIWKLKSCEFCSVILIIREAYLGQLYELEKKFPGIFPCRFRVKYLGYREAEQIIRNTLILENIHLKQEEATVNEMILNISEKENWVNPTYLQIYLDRMFHESNRV